MPSTTSGAARRRAKVSPAFCSALLSVFTSSTWTGVPAATRQHLLRPAPCADAAEESCAMAAITQNAIRTAPMDLFHNLAKIISAPGEA
jgi:hypothetical protein